MAMHEIMHKNFCTHHTPLFLNSCLSSTQSEKLNISIEYPFGHIENLNFSFKIHCCMYHAIHNLTFYRASNNCQVSKSIGNIEIKMYQIGFVIY